MKINPGRALKRDLGGKMKINPGRALKRDLGGKMKKRLTKEVWDTKGFFLGGFR